ncbi:hypothetical protein DMENIID0001_140500 [Sergentomyia squamirostris]
MLFSAKPFSEEDGLLWQCQTRDYQETLPNSVEDMKKAIMAVLRHKSSTDDNPEHDLCPQTEDTWCKYWKAVQEGEEYQHSKPIPAAVVEAITPVYEALTDDNLLERCLGGFTQNNNESFHASIWKLAPKHLHGTETVSVAVDLATITFNLGMLEFNHAMLPGISLENVTANYIVIDDDIPILVESTKRTIEVAFYAYYAFYCGYPVPNQRPWVVIERVLFGVIDECDKQSHRTVGAPAIRNAAKAVFADKKLKMCWAHMKIAVEKKVNSKVASEHRQHWQSST